MSEVAGLLLGGCLAGVVNTLAGGGSLVSVPLLVLLGLPGTVANGTNRVGILLQSIVATWRFRSSGLLDLRAILPVLAPVVAGSLVGALAISQVSNTAFERLFGLLMVLLLPALRPHRAPRPRLHLGRPGRLLLFFAIGLYGGAFQVGVGVLLVLVLARAGYDLVRANAIKVATIVSLTAVAIPVFAFAGQIAWRPAAILAVGFAAGAELGVRLAVAGGERLLRPVLAVAVLALAARMLGLL